jgi:hypothetical protein
MARERFHENRDVVNDVIHTGTSSKHHCDPYPDGFRETHTCGICSVTCP